jgi:hypothetical protein
VKLLIYFFEVSHQFHLLLKRGNGAYALRVRKKICFVLGVDWSLQWWMKW